MLSFSIDEHLQHTHIYMYVYILTRRAPSQKKREEERVRERKTSCSAFRSTSRIMIKSRLISVGESGGRMPSAVSFRRLRSLASPWNSRMNDNNSKRCSPRSVSLALTARAKQRQYGRISCNKKHNAFKAESNTSYP